MIQTAMLNRHFNRMLLLLKRLHIYLRILSHSMHLASSSMYALHYSLLNVFLCITLIVYFLLDALVLAVPVREGSNGSDLTPKILVIGIGDSVFDHDSEKINPYLKESLCWDIPPYPTPVTSGHVENFGDNDIIACGTGT